MYRVGDFAKITGLTDRTIRYYDEIGLLTPEYIDPYTGYRYYSDNSLKEFYKIKLLKDVNFSLEEIIQYKDQLSSDIIDGKIVEINNQVSELENKVEKLYEIKNNLLVQERNYNANVKVRKLEPRRKVA